MTKASRLHHGDEFGKSGSGSATVGMNGPVIGAGAMIAVDGMVERESGATPPPPPFSMRALLIGLVVMFLVGIVIVVVLTQALPKAPAYGGAVDVLKRLEQSPAGAR